MAASNERTTTQQKFTKNRIKFHFKREIKAKPEFCTTRRKKNLQLKNTNKDWKGLRRTMLVLCKKTDSHSSSKSVVFIQEKYFQT